MNLMSYRIHGLTLASALALPELVAVPEEQPPDAVVMVGTVPERLPEVEAEGPLWMAGKGEFLLAIPEVARYRISGGNRILVDAMPGVAAGDVRAYLLGTVLGMLLHQRGLLALHAGAIEVNGQVVAFAGHSGAGKSTLVAHLRQRGYRVISDDTLAISFDAQGQPWARPSFARIKLWADALKHLAHVPEQLVRDLTRLEKFHLLVEEDRQDTALPLASVILLNENKLDDGIHLERLRGLEAVNALSRQTYKPRLLKAAGLGTLQFQHCSRAAGRIQVMSLRRPKALAHMNTVLDRLEASWNPAT